MIFTSIISLYLSCNLLLSSNARSTSTCALKPTSLPLLTAPIDNAIPSLTPFDSAFELPISIDPEHVDIPVPDATLMLHSSPKLPVHPTIDTSLPIALPTPEFKLKSLPLPPEEEQPVIPASPPVLKID